MAPHPSELGPSNPVASDGRDRVEDFVASQTRYAKARVNEGRAVRASWDISTPEKDKARLHRDQPSAGFETPVLKPRAAQTQVEPRPRPTSPPRLKAPQSPKRDKKKANATSAFVEAVSSKRQKRQNDMSAERQPRLRAPKSSRKRCHPRSDTDEEHLARLADRRERKREKREIMNPRDAKPSRKERKDNATGGPTNKKKQKIPAGLALMHGFSSANVGKTRLTVEPPLNFGVFNKGRASEKVKVDETKRSKDKGFSSRIFSEDRFLNSRPAKQPAEHASGSKHSETMSSKSTSHESSSSLVKLKRLSAVQLRKTPIKIRGTVNINRRRPSIHTHCDDKEMGTSACSKTGAELTPLAKPGKSRSSIQSVSWAIEKDCSLPSTSSEIAIASVKSKTETAFLDVRTARWGKVLKDNDNVLDTKALSPLKTTKDLPAASILPTITMTREIASKVPPEIDEPATIGPWESASQVARSVVLHPQEPGFECSKFFPLPPVDKSGSAEHTTHLAPLEKDIGSARFDSDANPSPGEPLVRGSASLDCHGEGQLPRATILSALANTSSAIDTLAFPAERTSVLQTSSLDSVDRALLILGAPETANFPSRPSQIRRRSIPHQEFNLTPEDMELYQYGLESINSNCEAPLPLLHFDGSEEIVGTSRPPRNLNSDSPGTLRNTQHRSLDFQGVYQVGELETYGEYGEEAVQCYEDYPSTAFDSPEYASDMEYTMPSSPYERPDEAILFTNEGDTSHDMAMDSMSGASADFSAQPEEDEDARTNIHLWDDAVWPRQGELTNVQRVEQDVAKKLKGHWFPYKF